MTRTRFDDLCFRAVVAIGAVTITFALTQSRSLAVTLTYLAVFVAGGLTTVALEGIALAILVRREGKAYDRDQVSLAEANGAFHGGNL